MVRIPFDKTHVITISYSIELPFWISIRSGEYKLPEIPGMVRNKLTLRNDLWLVSTANIVDSRLISPYEFIVDETQVADRDYLNRITGENARYFHKRKMKTTAIRNVSLLPFEGVFSEKPGTDAWKKQVEEATTNAGHEPSMTEHILRDLNQLIDRYCAVLSMNDVAEEVRHVSSYETLVRVFVTAEAEGVKYAFPSKFIMDRSIADIPFPPYYIPDNDKFISFQEALESLEEPVFHQLQWIRTRNNLREKRYQEALLSATQTLEALAYKYLDEKQLPKNKIKAQGIAKWILDLEDELREFFAKPDLELDDLDYWVKVTCRDVARLWKLRNDVVHNERVLSDKDRRVIEEGITSMYNLRRFFLSHINQELLERELQFESLFERVPIEEETNQLRNITTLRFHWRRELDAYQNPVESYTDDSSLE